MFKKIVLIASALLIALAFSGCSKKPRRPNPLDTVMGQGDDSRYGANGGDFDPQSMSGDGAEFGLQSRSSDGSGDWAERARRGVLPTVYFDFNSASIGASERTKIDRAAEYLRNNPQSNLVLEGHCDWRGTTEYNLALGDRRAQAVRNYLETLGISGDRLQTLSKGDLNADEGASAAQMEEDRRVEILLVD